MDIDRFISRNEPTWQRLAILTAQSRRGSRRLGPGELDELVGLYQRVSAQLSHARTAYADPPLTRRLTALVANASGVIYGKRARTLRTLGTFFAVTFPAAVWHSRRFVATAALITLGPALAVAIWLATAGDTLDTALPQQYQDAFLEAQEGYYTADPSTQFFTEVTVNNIHVAILAFGAGIAFCVGTAYVLAFNGVNIGTAAAIFAADGRLPFFLGQIAPHGLLEVSAIVIAGGAGLSLGWAVIAPGDRTRTAAATDQGRRSVTVVLGLTGAFVAAGLVEGFITGSALPLGLKIAIGGALWLAFCAYLVTQGRLAASRGLTGVMGETDPARASEHQRCPPRATMMTRRGVSEVGAGGP
ncbi:stage II sporulation protein M [soil metagenome]